MLDNNDRIALIDQLVQHIHQHADILKVQSGGRLIKNIERLACIPFGKFGGKLHTLAFATGKRGRRLSQFYITQPHLLNYLYLIQNLRHVFKKFHRAVNCHIQHIGNRLPFETHFQGFPIVAFAMADLTRNIHVGQEVHFNSFITIALAGFATPPTDIEREASRLVTANFSFGQTDKQVTDVRKDSGISGGIGTRSTPQRRLIHIYHLIYIL